MNFDRRGFYEFFSEELLASFNWSGLPVVYVRPTVFLEGFFLIFTSDSVKTLNQIRLPFGEGKTSPIAAEDVARVIATLLINPQPHIGKIYHLPVHSLKTCISLHRSIRRHSAEQSLIRTFQSTRGVRDY
jgi:hypothetical protein